VVDFVAASGIRSRRWGVGGIVSLFVDTEESAFGGKCMSWRGVAEIVVGVEHNNQFVALVEEGMNGDGEIREELFAWIGCGDAPLAELMVLLEIVCERAGSFNALDWRAISSDYGDST
jgi:hypothetical protein